MTSNDSNGRAIIRSTASRTWLASFWRLDSIRTRANRAVSEPANIALNRSNRATMIGRKAILSVNVVLACNQVARN